MALILFSCCHSFSLKCHFQEDVEMKDSTTSQEDDESEDEGLEEVLSGAHNLEQVTLILSLCHGVFTNQFIFRYT